MKKVLLSLLLLVSLTLVGQDNKIFTRTQEFYINGDTQVIGNNILSKNEQKPFNEVDRVNDEYKMRYVDIDGDDSTFSSSSAYLEIPENATITYAGLYWTATYPGAKGGKRLKKGREVYKTLEGRERPIEMVKFKMPQGNYLNLAGEIIYDGADAKMKILQRRAPYVCFKDVTQELLALDNPSGYYTVANVSALRGVMSGGSSAGWMLYVIYERDEDALQYITTYHGFEFINKQPVKVEFGNFQSPERGEVATSITVSALEGDNSLKRDQIGIYNPEENAFTTLDNKVRASDNFFNSSITRNDSLYTKRKPNSKNTLGFDIAKLTIPNKENKIIANNATGVKLQFKTRADRFFLFFTAFQTTISEQFYQEVTTPKKEEIAQITTQTQEEARTMGTVVEPDSILKKIGTTTSTLPPTAQNAPAEEKVTPPEVKRAVDTPGVSIPDITSGYYIVTNVFSSKENAERWAGTLLQQGKSPQIFKRPRNGLYYVCVDYNTNATLLFDSLKTLRKEESLKKSWLLKINLP